MLTFTALRQELGWTQHELTAQIRRGLPWHPNGNKKEFDHNEVARWLLAEGLATYNNDEPADEPLPVVATNQAEAGKLLADLFEFQIVNAKLPYK